MKRRLIQIVGCYSERDGISNIIKRIHEEALKQEWESYISSPKTIGEIELEYHDPNLQILKKIYNESKEFKTIFIYHFGIRNNLLDDFFINNPIKNAIFYYHNITPSYFYTFWDQNLEAELTDTRMSLDRLLRSSNWVLTGDSYFNLNEITEVSARSKKLPPINPNSILLQNEYEKDEVIKNKKRIEIPSLLFVGRFAPNKKHEILIYLSKYLKVRGIKFKLNLVGRGVGIYFKFIKVLIKALRLQEEVQIHENVSEIELEKLYQMSQYFVVSSEHEGFCLPVLESLNFGCITIARPFAALEEIMKGSPGLVHGKKLSVFFQIVEAIINQTYASDDKFSSIQNECKEAVKSNLKDYWSIAEFITYLKSDIEEMEFQKKEHFHAKLNHSKITLDFEKTTPLNPKLMIFYIQVFLIEFLKKTIIFSFSNRKLRELLTTLYRKNE